MRLLAFVLSVVVSLAWVAGCEAPAEDPNAQSGEPGPPPGSTRDETYAEALAAANRFCEAWRERDVDTAVLMASPRLRREHGEGGIATAIAGAPNAEHVGYEISHGRPGDAGAMLFDVRLMIRYTGQSGDRLESPEETVRLIRPGNRWLVDAFAGLR
jgi:hypothetical protein